MHKFLFMLFLPIFAMAAELGEDGFYDDPLFEETFLDLKEDATSASESGRTLMVVVEQDGCPYCREMHEVNMQRDEIREEIGASFMAMQMDLFGSREVTDFDGEVMEEREFIAKHGIMFTPTILFFDGEGNELFRVPGYFKPFHHHTALKYVSSGAHKRTDFQRFIGETVQALEEAGEEVEVW